MSKALWRQRLKQRLGAVRPEDRVLGSQAIATRVVQLPRVAEARVLMAFLSLPLELDTSPLLQRLLALGKLVAVPRMSWSDRSLTPVRLESLDQPMARVRGGVREPVDADPLDARQLDVVLVPGLGFDRSGHRLGWGAGFYDRFLAALPDGVLRCGLAFQCQLMDALPHQDHDIAVDALITEGEICHFGS